MNNHTVLPRCTAQRHNGRFCDAPSMEDVPFPICFKHAYRLFRRMADTVERAERDKLHLLTLAMRQMDEDRDREAKRRENAVVYYVQVGNLCKIGTTVNLRQRLASYPPYRKLLAIEPGSRDVEAKRLRQFSSLLEHGNEWFRFDEPLLLHIDNLRRTAA